MTDPTIHPDFDAHEFRMEVGVPVTHWYAGNLYCRVCGDVHIAVWPEDVEDEQAMECPHCGAMACGPVEAGDDEFGTDNGGL